jgi:Protein of unknown function (DUF3563)
MFKNLFKARTEADRIDEYLADAVDLADLENRIRRIDRREAPWQIKSNQNLVVWAWWA